jgi:hypothetical protein
MFKTLQKLVFKKSNLEIFIFVILFVILLLLLVVVIFRVSHSLLLSFNSLLSFSISNLCSYSFFNCSVFNCSVFNCSVFNSSFNSSFNFSISNLY